MRFRWLSTFTVLGALLLVLGVAGLVLGPRFIYDPGQIATGHEALCYLLVGVLMLVNGVLAPSTVHEDTPDAAAKPAPVRAEASAVPVAAEPRGE